MTVIDLTKERIGWQKCQLCVDGKNSNNFGIVLQKLTWYSKINLVFKNVFIPIENVSRKLIDQFKI